MTWRFTFMCNALCDNGTPITILRLSLTPAYREALLNLLNANHWTFPDDPFGPLPTRPEPGQDQRAVGPVVGAGDPGGTGRPPILDRGDGG